MFCRSYIIPAPCGAFSPILIRSEPKPHRALFSRSQRCFQFLVQRNGSVTGVAIARHVAGRFFQTRPKIQRQIERAVDYRLLLPPFLTRFALRLLPVLAAPINRWAGALLFKFLDFTESVEYVRRYRYSGQALQARDIMETGFLLNYFRTSPR
jgi:hypothetical protein